MARAAKATTVVDEIQNYLNGVAKSLVDRLYGPNGPAWGTRLSELEATVVAIRQHLSERMLHDVLQRQQPPSTSGPRHSLLAPRVARPWNASQRPPQPPARTLRPRTPA